MPSVSCPGSQVTLWCYCVSAWGLCPQTAFPPTGDRCERKMDRCDGNVCTYWSPPGSTSNRRRQGLGGLIQALCSDSAPTPQSRGKFLLTPSVGSAVYVNECPPGYISEVQNNMGGGVCTVCRGWSTRRRTSPSSEPDVCFGCPPGRISKSGSDDCQLMQYCPFEQCNPCKDCIEGLAPTLATCVQGNECYHPGTTWCSGATEGMMQCQAKSLGCTYKLMCQAACVCSSWKNVFCGGVTDNKPCPSALLLIANASTQAEKLKLAADYREARTRSRNTSDAGGASLDDSLSGKRSCA